MSSMLKTRVLIAVKGGDSVDSNRKNGKSNTGTYFVCSKKDYEHYESFFLDTNKYILDIKRIAIYGTIFKEFLFERKDEFKGKMESFDGYLNYLTSQLQNPEVNITIRNNDARIFMRFEDNSKDIVNAFRNILYQDLSYIVLEKNENEIFVFPEIEANSIQIKKNNNCGLAVDDDVVFL